MFQVIERGNFAGGVARQRETDFSGIDAAAVIANLDQPAAAPLEFHFDAPSAGIECIFNQFFHHGSGPLDHLAGSDLIDEGLR